MSVALKTHEAVPLPPCGRGGRQTTAKPTTIVACGCALTIIIIINTIMLLQ